MANPLISPLVLAQLQQAIRQGTLPHAIPLTSASHQIMSTSGQQQRDQVPTAARMPLALALASDSGTVTSTASTCTARSTCTTKSTSDNTVSDCDYFRSIYTLGH